MKDHESSTRYEYGYVVEYIEDGVRTLVSKVVSREQGE